MVRRQLARGVVSGLRRQSSETKAESRFAAVGGLAERISGVAWILALVPVAAASFVVFAYLTAPWTVLALVLAPLLYVSLFASIRLLIAIAYSLALLFDKLIELPGSVEQLADSLREFRDDVHALSGEVGYLRGNFVDLTTEVERLPGVVARLGTRVDALYGSLESAQFWRLRRYGTSRHRRRRAVRERDSQRGFGASNG